MSEGGSENGKKGNTAIAVTEVVEVVGKGVSKNETKDRMFISDSICSSFSGSLQQKRTNQLIRSRYGNRRLDGRNGKQ